MLCQYLENFKENKINKRKLKKIYKKDIKDLNKEELKEILKDCGIKNVKSVAKNKGGVILINENYHKEN